MKTEMRPQVGRVAITLSAVVIAGAAMLSAAQAPTVGISARDLLARVTTRAAVEYPPEDAAGRVQGVAVIQLFVEPDGRVARTEVIEAPSRAAGEALEASLRRWTFRPLTAPSGEYAVIRSKLIFYFTLRRDTPEVLPAQEMGRAADVGSDVEFQEINDNAARKLVEGGATLLDIRSRSEFQAGHKQDAINIPENELTPRSRVEIPPGATVILDCSGSATSLCPFAVRILQRSGVEKGYIVRQNPDL